MDAAGPSSKKQKTVQGSAATPQESLASAIVPATPQPQQAAAATIATTLVSRDFERLVTIINPDYVKGLEDHGTIGYHPTHANRLPTARYYQINVVSLRTNFSLTIQHYLSWKLVQSGHVTIEQADEEATAISPVIADACMAALYAKLRTIHKQYGTYAARYNVPPIYNKDIELPLPFADAIQSFGTYIPNGITTNTVYVPVFPENTQHQGMSTANWHAYTYEAYMEHMREMKIPLKSVDARLKSGSAWWTYKATLVNDHYDLRCIMPPSNYSDHSVCLAGLFLLTNPITGDVNTIIQHHDDEPQFPKRAIELPVGFPLRAFAALCHAKSDEWNVITPLTGP